MKQEYRDSATDIMGRYRKNAEMCNKIAEELCELKAAAAFAETRMKALTDELKALRAEEAVLMDRVKSDPECDVESFKAEVVKMANEI